MCVCEPMWICVYCVLCMFAFGNICVLVLVFKLVLLLTYVCVVYTCVC